MVPDQDARYRQVSESLARLRPPWAVPFEYLPQGILCKGLWYPVVKMEWVEAIGLLTYIESHLWQASALGSLAQKFAVLVTDLGAKGLAHGDLQHGNILVTPAGDLKLIDYDGMFVPGMEPLGASEIGHANYQSPSRTLKDWGSQIDRFSTWVIYGSLVALVAEPMLWTLLHREGDEALLFHREDFSGSGTARIMALLSQDGDAYLRDHLALALRSVWVSPLASVPAP